MHNGDNVTIMASHAVSLKKKVQIDFNYKYMQGYWKLRQWRKVSFFLYFVVTVSAVHI